MQDRPTAPELLDAMAANLFGEVREWVPRERRFQMLVLANLCAVIARELRAGAEPSLADARLFRELLRSRSSGDRIRRPVRRARDRRSSSALRCAAASSTTASTRRSPACASTSPASSRSRAPATPTGPAEVEVERRAASHCAISVGSIDANGLRPDDRSAPARP